MSLQPLPAQIQNILHRAMRTQYVVLPAQIGQLDINDDDQDQETSIIQQFFSTPISSVPPLLPIPLPHVSVLTQEPEQPEQQQTQTTETQPDQQTNKITKAQALSLRLILGFVAAFLFVLGLLTAISSDYLQGIISEVKEVFQKEE
jgi:hypothetical protein